MSRVKIARSAHDAMCGTAEHEACGIVAGRWPTFMKTIEVRNADRRPNRFRMRFLSRAMLALRMLLGAFDSYIVFHVHGNYPFMSRDDVKDSRVDGLNIIVHNGEARMYRVMKTENRKKVPVLEPYEVIDG